MKIDLDIQSDLQTVAEASSWHEALGILLDSFENRVGEKYRRFGERSYRSEGEIEKILKENYKNSIIYYISLKKIIDYFEFDEKSVDIVFPDIDTMLDANSDKRDLIDFVFGVFNELKIYFDNAGDEIFVAECDSMLDRILGSGFSYTFSDEDLKRAQEILNQLRDHINESQLFEPDHKRRLLLRIEAAQTELHKSVSDLDRFWGFVGDAGVAIGKFGNDAKPFVDRIRELTQLIWRTQASAERLPSSAELPSLNPPSSEE